MLLSIPVTVTLFEDTISYQNVHSSAASHPDAESLRIFQLLQPILTSMAHDRGCRSSLSYSEGEGDHPCTQTIGLR